MEGVGVGVWVQALGFMVQGLGANSGVQVTKL